MEFCEFLFLDVLVDEEVVLDLVVDLLVEGLGQESSVSGGWVYMVRTRQNMLMKGRLVRGLLARLEVVM